MIRDIEEEISDAEVGGQVEPAQNAQVIQEIRHPDPLNERGEAVHHG